MDLASGSLKSKKISELNLNGTEVFSFRNEEIILPLKYALFPPLRYSSIFAVQKSKEEILNRKTLDLGRGVTCAGL